MGIRLIVEVLDHWQDHGLTAGERSDLIAIAENANDSTRTTWGSLHEDYVLRRVGKNAAAWRNAIGKLMKKGVLAYAMRNGRELSGFPGQHAVYRVLSLCPEAPHDGLRGQCTRQERVTSRMTHSLAAEEAGHPAGDPMQGTGHLTGEERITAQVTPSPPDPSTTTPPPPPVADVCGNAPVPGQGGGGGDRPAEHQQFAAKFVDALDYRGQLPNRLQRGRLVDLVSTALARGWDLASLSRQIEPGPRADSRLAVYLHRLEHLEGPPRRAAPVPLQTVVPLQTCDGCERAFRSNEPGKCGDCRREGASL